MPSRASSCKHGVSDQIQRYEDKSRKRTQKKNPDSLSIRATQICIVPINLYTRAVRYACVKPNTVLTYSRRI